ncbi:cutinase family protein [Corynebacterium sp. sy017]|uniref:cutinase family protein n=1 Tax=unclassified Corynebacterium TaxID=2624378 RepID=UPI0011869469|nr:MULTISPECIES: cutinase family protein [unclassified Corynebacterium]MBP3088523.1 cutinase family protein [Corynebacterium sp. sy017]TSD91828.1 cutinase family protein [Corynebacterium sp. SY003]
MRKLFTVVATIVVLGIILLGVGKWFIDRGAQQGSQVAEPQPPAAEQPHQEQSQQSDSCPAVEVIAAPGTWESRVGDDPTHPTANPRSYMLSITQPLQERFPAEQVKVWTLPYPAQFRNINAMNEMSYDDSRTEGTRLLEEELANMSAQCPTTDYIITGFSQGAVIAGDIANKIGTGTGVIPAERVRGIALVADGRRENGVGQTVGNPVGGVGAELALHPVELLVQPIVPGASMRGPRPGGFGTISDRVFQICAAGDAVCDAPAAISDAASGAQSLVQGNAVHAQYATNPNVVPGSTASEWIVSWISDLVQ